jgi:hypothetical protein
MMYKNSMPIAFRTDLIFRYGILLQGIPSYTCFSVQAITDAGSKCANIPYAYLGDLLVNAISLSSNSLIGL